MCSRTVAATSWPLPLMGSVQTSVTVGRIWHNDTLARIAKAAGARWWRGLRARLLLLLQPLRAPLRMCITGPRKAHARAPGTCTRMAGRAYYITNTAACWLACGAASGGARMCRLVGASCPGTGRAHVAAWAAAAPGAAASISGRARDSHANRALTALRLTEAACNRTPHPSCFLAPTNQPLLRSNR